jgi:hypothetical protein
MQNKNQSQNQNQLSEWSRGCVAYVQGFQAPEYSKYKRNTSAFVPTPYNTENQYQYQHSTLCIPRIPANITHEHIQQVFSKLNAGTITKITDIQLRNETDHKRILLQILWNQTTTAQYIQNRLFAGNNVKIVYRDPWYWKVVLGRPKIAAFKALTSNTGQ